MDLLFFIYLSSGLFLGWSLGANDAANIFGTAVGSKMIRFRTAAIIASVFIIIGAVYTGSGASNTLGELGKVNALPGAFMVALSAAVAVYWMIEIGLPVSTSQSIVGAIIGWNLYCNQPTDYSVLSKIVSTWVTCPALSGFFALVIYYIIKLTLHKSKIHILRRDSYIRLGLIIIIAFGGYALGANNIANVMGVFVDSSPFPAFDGQYLDLNQTQVLFFIGGLAISLGVLTYSHKVINTVGKSLMPLSPTTAWVAVFAHSLVLFLFASQGLKNFLEANGLPTLPLVPVSSSQAIIGAVIGIGLAKGGREIKWSVIGKIALGWVATPLISAVICFVSLFFMENVFNQVVFEP